MTNKDMTIRDKAMTMIEIRDHSMDLSSEQTNVQSLDSDGMVIDVSPGWLKMTGYEKADVIGHSFREFLVDETLGKVKSEFPHLRDYGFVNNVSLKMRRKDGVIIEAVLNGSSRYDKDGKFERTFCEIRSLDYYMNSTEAVSGILTMEKFLRMIMNLKTNISVLYQYILDESYTIPKLTEDLLVVLSEPSEIEKVMVGMEGQSSDDPELEAARNYYHNYHRAFPSSDMLLVGAEGYYGKVSEDLENKSVIIMSVNSHDLSEATIVFIEFNNSNVAYKEWHEAFGDIRLQIEPLIVLVNTLKEISDVDETLKKLL